MGEARESGFEVDGRRVGEGEPAWLIAEIGINHEGDVGAARELVRRSAEAGADADKIDVALIEIGPGDAYARLEELRRIYPRARIIAIGQPAAPEIYDGVTPMPIKPDRLRSALTAEAA